MNNESRVNDLIRKYDAGNNINDSSIDNSNFGKHTQSFTIGSKPSEGRRDLTPGPGAYDADKALSQTKSRAPTAKIVTPLKASVVSTSRDDSIGPGSYLDPNASSIFTKAKNSFTIGEKREPVKSSVNVAPGQYDPHNADSMTKRKTQNVLISPSRSQG